MQLAVITLCALVAIFGTAGLVAGLIGLRTRTTLVAFSLAFAVVVAAAALLVGCAHAPIETRVRRVDSLTELSRVGAELGRDGWHVASVVELDGGRAFVVVLERKARP